MNLRCRTGRILPLLGAALVLSACGTASTGTAAPASATGTPTAASRLVDPAGFAANLAEPRRVSINVHVPFEGAIAGTDLMLAYDQIRAGAPGLPADRAAPLAIYCRTGRMSAIAARELAALGYTDIVELAGGMAAWTAAGRPLLERSPA